MVATDWGGNANGYFGFGAGTGGSTNQQQVEIISVQTGSATSIAENSSSGAVVGLAAAVDPDRTGTVTYSLTDNAGGRFAINSTTGQITVASGAVLDFEANSSHNVVVQATDQGSLTFSKTLTINVSNVNEAPVDVSTGTQSITITNPSFESIVLSDAAFTGAATGWTVSNAGSFNPATSDFSSGNGSAGSNVAYADGTGSLSQTLGTNFDSSLNYRLSVDVARRLNFSSANYSIQLYAGATLIGSYASTPGDNGIWATVNVDVTGSSFAAANSQALRIVLSNTSASGQVEFDNLSLTSTSATASVAENSSNGTVVTTVTGLDRDAGNTLSYSLTNDAGGRFTINNTTGQITVLNGSLLNFETNTSHTVVVRATDQGTLSFDRTMTIGVTNVNEAPTDMGFGTQFVGNASTAMPGSTTMPSLDDFTLEIKATPRQAITLVAESNSGIVPGVNGGMAVMPDHGDAAYGTSGATTRGIGLAIGTNGVVVYQHSSGLLSSLLTYSGTIAPDSDIAVVFVNKTPSLYINGVLVDTGIQSTATSLRPTVGATGTSGIGGGSIPANERYFDGTLSDYRIWNSALDATTINNNRTAAIASGTPGLLANMLVTSINENAANGTVVGRARGYDPDAGATFGYTLTDNAGGRFAINNTTGEISVLNSSLLDFETATNHTVTVRATDQSGLNYDENVTIRLRNVNEAPTALTLTGTTTGAGSSAVYNATLDSYYAYVSASLGWEAAMDNAQASFLGGVSGTLAVVNSAAETAHLYTLSTITNLIGFSDKLIDGVWVAFQGDTPVFQVWSGSSTGTAVAGNYTNFASGQPNNSGGSESYAVFQGASSQTWNDVAGSLTRGSFVEWSGAAFRAAAGVAGNVMENATAGTVVGTLAAADADAGETYTYSIVGSSSLFEVVGSELRVKSGATFNHESAPQHALTIRVTDSGNNTRDQAITVNVVNVNEAPTDTGVIGSTNLISNGSFETNTTGWTLSGATVRSNTQGATAGSYGLGLTSGNGAVDGVASTTRVTSKCCVQGEFFRRRFRYEL